MIQSYIHKVGKDIQDHTGQASPASISRFFFSYLINNILPQSISRGPPLKNWAQFYFYGDWYKQLLTAYFLLPWSFQRCDFWISMYFSYCQKVTRNEELSEIFIIQTEGSLTWTFHRLFCILLGTSLTFLKEYVCVSCEFLGIMI